MKTTYEIYEEAKGRANLAGLRLSVLFTVLLVIFPAACWLVVQGLEPRAGEEEMAPGRLRLGLLLLPVAGVVAHGMCAEARVAAARNAEAERLRWQAEAETIFPPDERRTSPPPGGAAAVPGGAPAAASHGGGGSAGRFENASGMGREEPGPPPSTA